ncbi:DEAD/DEAH box helicase [Myxococcota bacterium]|nr:DEAD/DEAH box helicase [Myxococcota bacterium]
MTSTALVRRTLRLSPSGHLSITFDADAPEIEAPLAARLDRAFERGGGAGLLWLGGREVSRVIPAELAYWRDLAVRYVTTVCTRPELAERHAPVPPPSVPELDAIARAVPPMPGAEYVRADVLARLWAELDAAFDAESAASGEPVSSYLRSLHPAWNVVGRVCLNLAENRRDEEAPFALLATYTSKLGARGKAVHLALGQALREYAGAGDKDKLLALLLPLQRASEHVAWLRAMVDAGEIYHPLRLSIDEAVHFLHDVPALERAGVVVRMPAAWRGGRPPRAKVTATVGKGPPSAVGTDALLDFHADVTVDGAPLTRDEIRSLLASSEGLAFVRGQWVEVDAARLDATLARFREVEALAAERGISFAEAMRLVSGTALAEDVEADPAWSEVRSGPWLAELLRGLRSPEGLARVHPGDALRGTLRPYQEVGVRWLHLLSSLGLGACLADDMGLGKTIQILSLLLVDRKGRAANDHRPSLLVAPASLLANWAAELERFAPDLVARVAHPSAMSAAELKATAWDELSATDLVITSYGTLLRSPWIRSAAWNLVILDEAQAIKNAGTQQARAVKKLSARARIALTGTPIENRLGDLWSLFDFLNPGLLGSAKTFSTYVKKLEEDEHASYGPLRELVRPYVLRRLKTDKSVISDLPDKTELVAWCGLSKRQSVLYQQAVRELAEEVGRASGMKRRGLILAMLLRLKQICNHPSQWLQDGAWAADDSGKLARLGELVEVIAAKQEKVLVFTQFREMTDPLADHLATLFGRPGLVLHGETAVKDRRARVKQFQEDERVPFFVLSLKAGGTGLNLTAASHVIHFDRWWNPAVENQATDRAFRIGQTKNVLVHKMVCRGTVEEKIDALIRSKQSLSAELFAGGGELDLGALPDDELLRLVALDLRAATEV